MLSDLRESGLVEQDADIVMMIYRDEYCNPETLGRGFTEVIITKHFKGPVGTAKLLSEPVVHPLPQPCRTERVLNQNT